MESLFLDKFDPTCLKYLVLRHFKFNDLILNTGDEFDLTKTVHTKHRIRLLYEQRYIKPMKKEEEPVPNNTPPHGGPPTTPQVITDPLVTTTPLVPPTLPNTPSGVHVVNNMNPFKSKT